MVKLMLLIAIVLHLPAVTISQTITLSGKQVTLPAAFAEIKKQTNYAVVFNPRLLDTTATISIDARKEPLEAFLKTILAKQSLRYRIMGTTIIISRNENNSSGSGEQDANQPMLAGEDFHGIIVEKNNRPLSGVSVVLKRTSRGTQTDVTGKFILKGAGEKDTIICSMIGYQTTSLPVVKKAFPMVVTMNIAISELDETVVQAYGVTSKRLATGSITRISGEEISKQPVMNPLLALQGRVPGMVVTPTTGFASSPVKVEIRGRNSLNKNFSGEPLYIIDGVPINVLDIKGGSANEFGLSKGYAQGGATSVTGGQSPLFGMDMNNIESIEVLKDGDATAIYGSRAANGVILITTKKTKPGKASVNVGVNQGITDMPNRIRMLNTQEYLAVRREAFKNDGITPTIANAPDIMLWDTTRYTNWLNELYGIGKSTGINAGLSVGDSKTRLRLQTNYQMQEDMVQRGGKNEAVNVNLNMSHSSLNQKFSISVTAGYGHTFVNAINGSGNISLPPNAPPILNSNGELNYEGWGGAIDNPYPFADLRSPTILSTNKLNSSLNISYVILKGLQFNVNAGYNSGQNTTNTFKPISATNPLEKATGTAFFGNTKSGNWMIEPTLSFNRFIGRGRFEILAGSSLQRSSTSLMHINAFGYTSDELIGSISNAATLMSTDNAGQQKYAALYGRISYNWENKIIVNLNGRRDGSSKFAQDRLFGNFGSIGLAWILSEEKWMKRVLPSWFSFFKIRSSYGLVGSDNVGAYQYLSQWGASLSASNSSSAALYNYDGVRPLVPKHAVNQEYHWEGKKAFTAAMELGFLKDRLTMNVDVYRNVSDDQLTEQPTPLLSGFAKVVTNSVAKVENTGFELTISGRIMNTRNFSWSASFNTAMNKNKLLAYPNLETSPHATVYMIGKPLYMVYLLHYLGIDPLTGDYSFEDYNKDGKVLANIGYKPGHPKDDRYVAVDLNPRLTAGLNSNLTFMGIGLAFSCSFSEQLQADPFLSTPPGNMSNLFLPASELHKYWRKPGDHAKYPRFTTGSLSTFANSDGYYSKTWFLRINGLELSYKLPDRWIKKTALKDCLFSISTSNIYTFTNYTGPDPNVMSLSSPPLPRNIDARLQFTF